MSELIKIASGMTKDELFERFMQLHIETTYMQKKLDEAHEEFDKAMAELDEVNSYLEAIETSDKEIK